VGARPNGTETLPPLGTVIEACPGKVTIIGRHDAAERPRTRLDATTWTGDRPTPRRLSPADVGPLAKRAPPA
jgi:hypothetical protein